MNAFNCLLLLILSISSFAQSTPILVKVADNQDPLKVFPITERYRYPEFQTGVVFDSRGKADTVNYLNIQTFSDKLETIHSNGDTVIVDNEGRYKNIQISRDFFKYDVEKGYFLVLAQNETSLLLSKTHWVVVRHEPTAENYARSQPMGGYRTALVKDPVTGAIFKNETKVYSKVQTLYLMDTRDNIELGSKTAFIALAPKHKDEIKVFISTNAIDLDNAADAKKLFAYCAGFTGKK
jgi:hypothetical protein